MRQMKKEYVLVIYPLDFPNVKPEVIYLWDLDNVYDASDFSKTYTLERFNHPNEFKGCHVVELDKGKP